MGFDVVFDAKFNVVSVKASEALNFKVEKEIVKKILEVAKKNKCQKVLCDYSKAALSISLWDIYDIPGYFERWGVPRNLMMAFVYSDDENKYEFFETVARNKGFATSVFSDKDEAIRWLINDSLLDTPES